MDNREKPLLNRGSLGATPVLDDDAIQRILEALGVELLTDFPQSDFARFLNDAAQFALGESFSTKPTSPQIQQFKASYESLLARSRELQRIGVAVPMPPIAGEIKLSNSSTIGRRRRGENTGTRWAIYIFVAP